MVSPAQSVSELTLNRFIVSLLLAVLPFAASAADKAAKPRANVATAEFTKDGEPNVRSTGVLVFDPTSGQTLFAKNAEQAAPIASITKLMTAMVVLDAKQPLDEVIEISAEDIDTVKNTHSRLPVG